MFLVSEIGGIFNQFGVQTFGSYELFGLIIVVLMAMFLLLMNMPISFVIAGVSFVGLALFISGYGALFSKLSVLIIIIIAVITALLFWKTLLGD